MKKTLILSFFIFISFSSHLLAYDSSVEAYDACVRWSVLLNGGAPCTYGYSSQYNLYYYETITDQFGTTNAFSFPAPISCGAEQTLINGVCQYNGCSPGFVRNDQGLCTATGGACLSTDPNGCAGTTCPAEQTYNLNTGQCTWNPCSPGFSRNDTGACVADGNACISSDPNGCPWSACPAGKTFDSNLGRCTGTEIGTGAATGSGTATGTVSGTVSGTVGGFGTGIMSGTVSGTVSSTLIGTGTGAGLGSSTLSGILNGTVSSSGALTGSITNTGTDTGLGTTVLTGTLSGTVSDTGALTGTITGQGTGGGLSSTVMTGALTGTVSDTGTLTGNISGTSDGTLTVPGSESEARIDDVPMTEPCPSGYIKSGFSCYRSHFDGNEVDAIGGVCPSSYIIWDGRCYHIDTGNNNRTIIDPDDGSNDSNTDTDTRTDTDGNITNYTTTNNTTNNTTTNHNTTNHNTNNTYNTLPDEEEVIIPFSWSKMPGGSNFDEEGANALLLDKQSELSNKLTEIKEEINGMFESSVSADGAIISNDQVIYNRKGTAITADLSLFKFMDDLPEFGNIILFLASLVSFSIILGVRGG